MSFLGYGDIVPNSNINPTYVNPSSSTYSGSFSSNEISGLHGGRSYNPQQIRKLKRKIKNISNIYKMKRRSHTRRLKKKLRTMTFGKRGRRHSSHRYAKRRSVRRHHQHGGYSQYQSNMPLSQGYSLGGILSASNSALATPPLYKAYDNSIDNYNHFTGKGFDSFGH
jgi:hypothetical protein